MRNIPIIVTTTFLLIDAVTIKAACPSFVIHVIKPPRPGAEGNTVPSMVWLHDENTDGHVDLIASHVAWMNKTEFSIPTWLGTRGQISNANI